MAGTTDITSLRDSVYDAAGLSEIEDPLSPTKIRGAAYVVRDAATVARDVRLRVFHADDEVVGRVTRSHGEPYAEASSVATRKLRAGIRLNLNDVASNAFGSVVDD